MQEIFNSDNESLCSSAASLTTIWCVAACVHEQIAAYENLLRRVMRAAPKAALLALDAFMFGSYNATNAGGQQVQLAEPYYNSGV